MGRLPDPTALFGEGWCLTLTRLAVDDALDVMGVERPHPRPAGLADATRRLIDPPEDGQVLLLARDLGGATLILELEGRTGWAGLDPVVLAGLTGYDGEPASSAARDPRWFRVVVADGDDRLGGLDLPAGRRWGRLADGVGEAWRVAGVPAEDDVPDDPGLSTSQLALLAAQAATGITVREEHLRDPWTGGLA